MHLAEIEPGETFSVAVDTRPGIAPSQVPGLDKAFNERTGLPVSFLNPLGRMLPNKRFDPEFLDGLAPALGVGVGLGLRRVDEQ